MAHVAFMSRLRSPHGEEVGRAELHADGVRFTDPALEAKVSAVAVRNPASPFRVLVPADCRAYLDALPYTFHGSYFWASLVQE